ncbi:hypothetical protein HYH02_002933 [Chlamydomonas schloesseri]|uniref:mannan endo-1,4-beta-mannosidase n=1 Tax=Chlamydomonas schloesseri TaxID=2026947 RepID=A0A835WTZ5_9CHLO|nr:hypothetical protein HYH02_002933 [Chlamydomonas schloesseri]|eukprot:KAG2452701.1 hypothetical protein HYH02_002933 [Chlamydomonas schloesseri]
MLWDSLAIALRHCYRHNAHSSGHSQPQPQLAQPPAAAAEGGCCSSQNACWQRWLLLSRGRRLACAGAALLLLVALVAVVGGVLGAALQPHSRQHQPPRVEVSTDSGRAPAGSVPSDSSAPQLPTAPWPSVAAGTPAASDGGAPAPADAGVQAPARAAADARPAGGPQAQGSAEAAAATGRGGVAGAETGVDLAQPAAADPLPTSTGGQMLPAAPRPKPVAAAADSTAADVAISSSVPAGNSSTSAAPNETALQPVGRCTAAGPDGAPFARINAQQQLVVRGCGNSSRRLLLVGFNNYLLPMAAGTVSPKAFQTVGGLSGRQAVTRLMGRAAAAGLNVVRTWAHSADAQFPFQVGPGVYLEAALAGLDHVVAAAAAAGLRLVLSLADNWKYAGGVDQYVDWSNTAPPRTRTRPPDTLGDPTGVKVGRPSAAAGASAAGVARPRSNANSTQKDQQQQQLLLEGLRYEAGRHALFFSDPGARELYRRHAAAILTRRNTLTGRLYRDEPAILAWSLLNEPRCEVWAAPNCTAAVQAWVEEMSAHLRALDPNHLITIGSEGFFGPSTPGLTHHNPGGDGGAWAAALGQDWVANNAAPHIDFASLHAWPDQWLDAQEEEGGDGSVAAAADSGNSRSPRSTATTTAAATATGTARGGAPAGQGLQVRAPTETVAAQQQRQQRQQRQPYAAFLSDWLSSHLTAAAELLRKPVLLDEFGKKVERAAPGAAGNGSSSSSRAREVKHGVTTDAAGSHSDGTTKPSAAPAAPTPTAPAAAAAAATGDKVVLLTKPPQQQPASPGAGTSAKTPTSGISVPQSAVTATAAAAAGASRTSAFSERDAVYNATYTLLSSLLSPSPSAPPAPSVAAPARTSSSTLTSSSQRPHLPQGQQQLAAPAAAAPPPPAVAPPPAAQPSAAGASRGLLAAAAAVAAGAQAVAPKQPPPPQLVTSVTVSGPPAVPAPDLGSSLLRGELSSLNLSVAARRSPPPPLMGSLFWMWQLPLFVGEAPDPYGVSDADVAVFQMVARHAAAAAVAAAANPAMAAVAVEQQRRASGGDSTNRTISAVTGAQLLKASSDSTGSSGGGGDGDGSALAPSAAGTGDVWSAAQPQAPLSALRQRVQAAGDEQSRLQPLEPGACEQQLLLAALALLPEAAATSTGAFASDGAAAAGAGAGAAGRSGPLVVSALAPPRPGPRKHHHPQQQPQQALRSYLLRRCRGHSPAGSSGGGAAAGTSSTVGVGLAAAQPAAVQSRPTTQPLAPPATNGHRRRSRGLLNAAAGVTVNRPAEGGEQAAAGAAAPLSMGCLRLWVRGMCGQSSVRSALAFSAATENAVIESTAVGFAPEG